MFRANYGKKKKKKIKNVFVFMGGKKIMLK